MSLSILLFAIIPLFAIPAILLPDNKIRIFSYSILIGFSLVFASVLLVFIQGSFDIIVGRGLYPAFGWFLKNNLELSINERYKIAFSFAQILIFFLVSTLSYVTLNSFYIGKNPSIIKNNNKFFNVLFRILMFFISYIAVSYFLISIRNLLCLEDGFLSSLFNLIYYIGA